MTTCTFKQLIKVFVLFVFIFSSTLAHAGEVSKSFLYTFGSKHGKTTSEKLALSINYNSDKYWMDERVSRDISQDVGFENFFGAGWKNKISETLDMSSGLIWQYDGAESNYLASLRGRLKDGHTKYIVFVQPYINRSGYITKGSIVRSGIIREIEYRSKDEMIMLSIGDEF